MKTRNAATLLAITVLTAGSGAQCNRRDVGSPAVYGPRALTQNPTLGDVIQVVNDNSNKIRSLFTTDATLTVPDAPSLKMSLAVERPKRLRMRAETALTGPELDIGSNDERFWFWIRRAPPPTVYYCRHEQFAASAAKQFVPVEPQWLLDAICTASFDPSLQHSPPQRNANGRLEIRTTVPTASGTMSKTTVVDEARGWVLEQHLYDERGQLIASALTNRHWRDPASGAVVPQEIEIRSAANQFSLKIDVRQWVVNSIPVDPTQLFTMPTVPGWNVVDLGDPNLRFGPSAAVPSPQVGSTSPPPAAMPPALAPIPTPTPAYGATPASYSVMGPMFAPPQSP
jgi:hypothetical protein